MCEYVRDTWDIYYCLFNKYIKRTRVVWFTHANIKMCAFYVFCVGGNDLVCYFYRSSMRT